MVKKLVGIYPVSNPLESPDSSLSSLYEMVFVSRKKNVGNQTFDEIEGILTTSNPKRFLSGDTTVIGVAPQRYMVSRFGQRLPNAVPEMLKKMIKFEARQLIPFPTEILNLGYELYSDVPNGEVEVTFHGIKKDTLEELFPFRVDKVYPAAYVVSKLTPNIDTEDVDALPGAVGVVNLSREGNLFTIVRNGKALFSRPIKIVNPEQNVAEMRRTLDYFISQPYGEAIDSLVCYSEVTPELKDIGERLGLEITHKSAFSKFVPTNDLQIDSRYALAAGGILAYDSKPQTFDLANHISKNSKKR